MVRFDAFRKSRARRRSRPSLAGVKKLDRILVQLQIDPVAIPQNFHCLSVNPAYRSSEEVRFFMWHGSRRTPSQFGTKETDGSCKLFADAHKIEPQPNFASPWPVGGFVSGVRGAVPSNGGKVMGVGILNNCWAVYEIAHESANDSSRALAVTRLSSVAIRQKVWAERILRMGSRSSVIYTGCGRIPSERER